jgi:hypothetical protein
MATATATFRMKTTSVNTTGLDKKNSVSFMSLLDNNGSMSFLDSTYNSHQTLLPEKPKTGFALKVVPSAMADHM